MEYKDERIIFLERRLTILERNFEELRLSLSSSSVSELALPERQVRLACDDPGIFAINAYNVERISPSLPFCWIGAEESIQMKLPIRPVADLTCTIFFATARKSLFGRVEIDCQRN